MKELFDVGVVGVDGVVSVSGVVGVVSVSGVVGVVGDSLAAGSLAGLPPQATKIITRVTHKALHWLNFFKRVAVIRSLFILVDWSVTLALNRKQNYTPSTKVPNAPTPGQALQHLVCGLCVPGRQLVIDAGLGKGWVSGRMEHAITRTP